MNLDNEQLNSLSAPERERYMELERLFASKGWKIVQTMAKSNAEGAFALGANASSWAQNREAFGNRTCWMTILNLEESTQQLFESKAVAAAQAAEIVRISEESEYE
jgi:hypothetical protein